VYGYFGGHPYSADGRALPDLRLQSTDKIDFFQKYFCRLLAAKVFFGKRSIGAERMNFQLARAKKSPVGGPGLIQRPLEGVNSISVATTRRSFSEPADDIKGKNVVLSPVFHYSLLAIDAV